MSSTDPAAAIPLPSKDVINLAWADLFIAAILLFPSGYVTWKHGKAGIVCWPIFCSVYVAQVVTNIYQIVKKNEPLHSNTLLTVTNSAVLAGLSLALIGIVYECNTILPIPPKSRTQKILLGSTHIVQTAAISIATYASVPSAGHEGGVKNKSLNGIGSIILLLVVFVVCGWMWPTWRTIRRYSGIHPNAAPARKMLWAAIAAIPFWLVRLVYVTAYAFGHDRSLDPIMGSFATRLVLLFGTYLGASVALLVGGWLGMGQVPPGTVEEYLGVEDGQRGSMTDVEMIVQAKR